VFYTEHIETLASVFMRDKGVKGVQFTGRDGISRFGETTRHVETDLDGMKVVIDITQGQKTGMFLDQRLNARLVEPFARGARVFDGHCNTGAWGCRAALAGATAVVAVDSSQGALDLAAQNARLNGIEGAFSFVCADVAQVLAAGEAYDVVVLDPPSLAKTRSQAARVLPVHQELHRAAIKALKPGGVLVTSCCSHFVEPATFEETLKRAARGARRDVLLLERRGPSPDHPVLLSMPETAYLTCLVAVVR
jgi:23S rRNA (cytosine1962-C5)-methyltransferase